MSSPREESVTLHYTDGATSDKIYEIRLEEIGPDQFTVTGYNGKRGRTLVPQKKTPTPVSYDRAKAIFSALEHEKRNHPRTPYTVLDRKQGPSSQQGATPNPTPKSSFYEPTGFVAVHPRKVTEDEANKLLQNDEYVAEQKLDGDFLSLRLTLNGRVTASNKLGKGILVPAKLASAIRQLASISGCEVSLGIAGEYLDSTLHVFTVWEKNGTPLLTLPQHLRVALKDKLASDLTNTLLSSNSNKTLPIKFVQTAQTLDEKLALYERVKNNNGEGLVFKHRESDLSFKFKLYETAEVILKANAKRSAECLAYHDGTLISLGSTTIPSDTVQNKIKDANLRDEPIVATVKYLYLSAPPAIGPGSGQLTQASFIRFRPECPPTDCTTAELKVVNRTVLELERNPADRPSQALTPISGDALEHHLGPSEPHSTVSPSSPATLFAL